MRRNLPDYHVNSPGQAPVAGQGQRLIPGRRSERPRVGRGAGHSDSVPVARERFDTDSIGASRPRGVQSMDAAKIDCCEAYLRARQKTERMLG